MKIVEVKVYNESGLPLPKYETSGATGMDVSAMIDVEIPGGETRLVPTGLFVEMPHGCEMLVFPRSGVSLKTGLRIANSVGKVDSDYRGNVAVIVWNSSNVHYTVKKGEKIAQVTVYEPPRFTWTVVDSKEALSDTKRGAGGFGHTGQ